MLGVVQKRRPGGCQSCDIKRTLWNLFIFQKSDVPFKQPLVTKSSKQFSFADSASGISVDHAYGHHKIPITYTYEMRGTGFYGDYGFFLPPQFILPNAIEIVESLIAMVHKSREYGYLEISPAPSDN